MKTNVIFFACAVLLKDHIIVIRFLYVNLLILFGRIHTFCKRMLKIVLRLHQKLEGPIIYHIGYLKKNFQSEFCLNWNTFEINIICLRFIQVKLTKISYIDTLFIVWFIQNSGLDSYHCISYRIQLNLSKQNLPENQPLCLV